MSLTKISINNFRCFKNVDLQLSPGINFFFGKNGSGKTSILESVFIFSSGKSFKSSNLASLVNYENDKFTFLCTNPKHESKQTVATVKGLNVHVMNKLGLQNLIEAKAI